MGKKTKDTSRVLQLMDKDYSYSQALKKVLNEKAKRNKRNLERNLNKYI